MHYICWYRGGREGYTEGVQRGTEGYRGVQASCLVILNSEQRPTTKNCCIRIGALGLTKLGARALAMSAFRSPSVRF